MNKQSKPSSRTTKASLEKALAAKTAELQQKDRLLEIETALERVRARAMAMRHSDELREVVSVVFGSFQQLDLGTPACSIGIFDEGTRASEWWVASSSETIMPRSFRIPYLEGWPKDWYQMMYDKWQQSRPFFAFTFEGEDKRALDHKLMSETEFGLTSDAHIEDMVPLERLILSYVTLTHGVIEVGTTEPIPEDQIPILQRFANVIDLTYTRFLDLQKAEAQAREAQIEAALERVRARTMGMHNSSELSDVGNMVFQQMKELGIPGAALVIDGGQTAGISLGLVDKLLSE